MSPNEEDDTMIDVRFREVVIDCADPRTLAAFWAGFTGYDATRGTRTGRRSAHRTRA
jgi:hypothetical protein